MKARKPHRVPLSQAAIDVLQRMPRRSDYIFPGSRRPTLNAHTMKMLLLRIATGASVHGFRSSFRMWVAEQTNFPGELAELALAHRVSSAVEAAYQRSDLFEKRRKLMDAWADYCSKNQSNAEVIPFRTGILA